MNPSAFDPASALSPARVSLSGKPEHAMTAALDDAVARLAAITEPTRSNPTIDGAQANAIAMHLIEVIAAAPSRREALKCLVATLASLCPEASVRGGLGKGRMSRFFDNRLGWLGPESSLHQKASDLWDGLETRSATAAGDDAPKETSTPMGAGIQRPSVRRIDRTIELSLPDGNGTGRCVVWIDGTLGEIDWLPSMAIAIGAVFWSRPSRSLPSLAIGVVKQSTILCSIAAVVLLVVSVWPVPYRVACTARVETTGGRFIATPFEATLMAANVRPGDAVTAGEVLLVLDGRPLRLERESLLAEIGQAAKEYDVALATRRIADAQQAELKQKQLTRQLDLISDRLDRLEVVSPIDGIVVSGDLEKHIGAPLELGQTLIEVAPLGRMRVELDVPEYEIAFVNEGNETRIKIDAIGGSSIRVPLDQVHPQSEIRDDQNVFIAAIDLDNTDGQLRPGMRGEAIVYGPRRPWIWSWVRGGFERALWWVGY